MVGIAKRILSLCEDQATPVNNGGHDDWSVEFDSGLEDAIAEEITEHDEELKEEIWDRFQARLEAFKSSIYEFLGTKFYDFEHEVDKEDFR